MLLDLLISHGEPTHLFENKDIREQGYQQQQQQQQQLSTNPSEEEESGYGLQENISQQNYQNLVSEIDIIYPIESEQQSNYESQESVSESLQSLSESLESVSESHQRVLEPHEEDQAEDVPDAPNDGGIGEDVVGFRRHDYVDTPPTQDEITRTQRDSTISSYPGAKNYSGPANREYANVIARLRTFNDWPVGLSQKPEAMAKAGFYYTGIVNNES